MNAQKLRNHKGKFYMVSEFDLGKNSIIFEFTPDFFFFFFLGMLKT